MTGRTLATGRECAVALKVWLDLNKYKNYATKVPKIKPFANQNATVARELKRRSAELKKSAD
jgi:hypothetical protein